MEHGVSLRVMRLARPSFGMDVQKPCMEPWDLDFLPGDSGRAQIFKSDMLRLPQDIGKIYLGETFSSFMTVHNGSSGIIENVQLRVELQTGAQKIVLTPTVVNGTGTIQPGQSFDQIVQHEVKEIGTYILQCTVSHKHPITGETMQFNKFFKFVVFKPLDVKTKLYSAESDEVLVEAQLQNITSTPLTLAKVSLEPAARYTVKSLNQNEDGSSVFGEVNFLNPQDSRQYLFCLTPKEVEGKKTTRAAAPIGKLDIIWKGILGEKGRLQTSQLERAVPVYSDIRVLVENIPSQIQLETPFIITCCIINTCDRPLDLTVSLDNRDGLMWVDSSGYALGTIQPHSKVSKDFSLFMTKCGLQTIGGLRLYDCFLKRQYMFESVGKVIAVP